MPKTIVICSDGTNNSYGGNLTNVGRLSLIARNVPGVQSVWYDAGVGVEPKVGYVTRSGGLISRWLGSAIGYGLEDNVKQAYLEIVKQYEPGAKVFLFGFSRGAYTVRVLAGLLANFGLLKSPDQKLLDTLAERYQKLFPEAERTFAEAQAFKNQYCVDCPIEFMGVWDTVSSVGWLHNPKTWPNTAKLNNVRIVRHALALDERRAKFRTNRVTQAPDLKEVWFSGVHSDVGGGYPEKESGLAKITLRWMLAEAVAAGLDIDPAQEKLLVEGPITGPDPAAEQHESLEGAWWALEQLWLPHRKQVNGKWVEEHIRYKGEGWRTVRAGDLVHQSVQQRTVKNRKFPPDGGVTWVP